MQVSLREVGNSLVTTIPKDVVQELNVKKGDVFEIENDGTRIVLIPIRKKKLKGELFLEAFYEKPIEDIHSWETENVETGDPVGEEVW